MVSARVLVTRYGGTEVLKVTEEPLRTPGIDEIRIKVECSGVALADLMRREGLYPLSPQPPFTPGYDAIGIIEEKGGNVTQYAVGDRVAVFFNGVGGYASHIYSPVAEVIPVPESLVPATALTILLNYVTAYQMLHRVAHVSEGDRVLIHGASGGVGTALLELGKLAKLKMFGTASAHKHPIVDSYGAVAIDYHSEDFVEVLSELAPEGMDAVFDPIGGRNWDRSMRTLNKQGTFIGYGYTSVFEQGEENDWAVRWKSLTEAKTTEQGNPVHVYSITTLKQERPEWFFEDVKHLFLLLLHGELQPFISHRIPFHEVARAHELLETSKAAGKIVLIHS
ncbi:medium chain dehydrogenase/reductase family protein [Brevibacillus choshinensis]|uniref:medium chain dehydrogenase/reductase family protein n=1 Tax=Brevibacillus choshinensis TaxID=54911 RepID=UPI002E248530|nr:medium chain dehydrogenase/reductase family protein [Brevibacillus choshinensis]